MIWVGLPDTPMNAQDIHRPSSYSGGMARAGNEAVAVAPNAASKVTGEIRGRRVPEAARR